MLETPPMARESQEPPLSPFTRSPSSGGRPGRARRWIAVSTVWLMLILPGVVLAQNLLRNPGFEDIPGC